MKRSLLALTAAAAVAIGLAMANSIYAGPETTPKAPTLPQGRIESTRQALAIVTTRDNIRTVTIDAAVGDGSTSTYNVIAATELNITAVTLSTGVTNPGEIFQGYVFLSLFEGPTGTVYSRPIFMASSGTQTIHLTFPDPVPMRAGDQFVFAPLRAASPGTFATYYMSLTGTVPTSATGMVTY